MPKQKPVNWQLIEDPKIYNQLQDLINKYHQGKNTINGVNIILMWKYNIKPDQDEYLQLADITKSPDKIRELRPHDIIIGLNKTAWELTTPAQQDTILDTQLERIAISTDKQDNPKEDDQGRTIYRLRKPQTTPNETIQKRHGTTTEEIMHQINQKLTPLSQQAQPGSYIHTQLNTP